MKNFDYSSLCRDAFVILHGVEKISYKGGDSWILDEGAEEHPLVPRLRAASVESLIGTPSEPEHAHVDDSVVVALHGERRANDAMRRYLSDLQILCEASGAPKSASGGDLMAWLKTRLT